MYKENFYSNQQQSIGSYVLCSSQLLGKGATGCVYRGYHSSTKAPVAIKHIDLATINDDATRTLLQNQKKALKMVDSPNVVKLHDIVQTSGNLYIITELLQGGTLSQLLAKRGPLDELEAMTLFRAILTGSTAITQANIIHRDLKPANILLTAANIPKIIDFGYCQVIMGGGVVRAFNVGSPAYMAPQALLKTLYSEKSDSWSLGVILYQMLHGITPDGGRNVKQFLQQVRVNPLLISKSLKAGLNTNVRQILQKSLKYQTEERISISGMKYLTDVYSIQHKGKSLSMPNANHNVILKSSIKSDKDTMKEKIANNTFTNLPGKVHRENQFDKFISTNPQLFAQGNPRIQPFTSQKLQSPIQPAVNPTGFISYNDFTKPIPPCLQTNQNSRISHVSISNNSSKGSSVIKDRSQNYSRMMMKGIGEGGWQSLSSKEIMDRPTGNPIYRQVTVRYL